MLSIQPDTALRSSLFAVAAYVSFALTTACSSPEAAAYQLGAQAQQQLDQGDLAGARKSIKSAIQKRDDLISLYLLSGKIEMAAQAPENAFRAFSNAHALDPVNQEALQGVAMLGLQTGHSEEAEAAADQLLALVPQQPTALLVKGLFAVDRRKYPEAIDAAERILAQSPTDEGAVILKARALYLSGSRAEAKDLLAKTVALRGQAPGLARIGLEFARAEGDAQGMLSNLAVLRAESPADPDLALDEANVRYKTGDVRSAAALVLAQFASKQLPPDKVQSFLDLWREYRPPLPSAAQLQGTAPALRDDLARFYLEAGRPADALVLVATGDSSSSKGIRTRALLATGKAGEAEPLARAVVAADPSQCDAQLTLAELAMTRRQNAAAVAAGQRASAECPGLAEAWLITARAYQQDRQDAQTQRVFRDGLDQLPDSWRLHAAFVAWLRGRQDIGAAASIARHLTRYAPNRRSSWQLLAASCADPVCQVTAEQGLAQANRSLVIDLKPGQVPRRGLFGQLGTS